MSADGQTASEGCSRPPNGPAGPVARGTGIACPVSGRLLSPTLAQVMRLTVVGFVDSNGLGGVLCRAPSCVRANSLCPPILTKATHLCPTA